MKIFVAILLLSLTATAQQKKLTVSAGLTASLTDVAGNPGIGKWFIKDLNTRSLGFYVGVTKPVGRVEIGIAWYRLRDADTNVPRRGGAEEWRYIRNFYFETNIIELSITKTIEIWEIELRVGPSIFMMPTYDSAERSTALLQPAVVLQCANSGQWQVNISYKKLFTDYLDGYSLRADPKDNDSFVTIGVSYTFYKTKTQFKCPRNIY